MNNTFYILSSSPYETENPEEAIYLTYEEALEAMNKGKQFLTMDRLLQKAGKLTLREGICFRKNFPDVNRKFIVYKNVVDKFVLEEEEREYERLKEVNRMKKVLELRLPTVPFRGFTFEETPHFGLCDFPTQFATMCPNYVGGVKFYQVTDPNFLVWRRKVSTKTGRVGVYIGTKDLSASCFPLFLYDGNWTDEDFSLPLLDQLWCFETQNSEEGFINFPSKLIYFSLGTARTIKM